MAIFSPGAVIASIHGSFGGITFRRTRTAAVLSLKPRPIQPHSIPQLERRVQFSTNIYTWAHVLTPEHRRLWSATARSVYRHSKLPSTTFLSGRNLFFRLYLRGRNLPYFSPYPGTGFMMLPATPISLDFTAGGPFNIDLSKWAPPYGKEFWVYGIAALPVPAWTTHEYWTSFSLETHTGGTINVYDLWRTLLPELSPGEHFGIATAVPAPNTYWSPFKRFYGTVHA